MTSPTPITDEINNNLLKHEDMTKPNITSGISGEVTRASLGAETANPRPTIGSREEFKTLLLDIFLKQKNAVRYPLGQLDERMWSWHLAELKQFGEDIKKCVDGERATSRKDIVDFIDQLLNNLNQE